MPRAYQKNYIDLPAKAQIAKLGIIAVEVASLKGRLGGKAAVARADDDRVALKDGRGRCPEADSAQEI